VGAVDGSARLVRGATIGTVAVCDPDVGLGESLRAVLVHAPGVRRVWLVERGEQLEAGWPGVRPDVVLVDAGLRDLDGVETTRRVLAGHPEAVVVVLVSRSHEPGETVDVLSAVQAGARGFVARDASAAELSAVLTTVVSQRVVRPVRSAVPQLTARELQVLVAMSRGRSNAEIGRELYLSEDTVKTHARRLFRKLGAADRAHAVAIGFRAGLVR